MNRKREKGLGNNIIMDIDGAHGPLLFILGITVGIFGVLFSSVPIFLSFVIAALFFYLGIGFYSRKEKERSKNASSIVLSITAFGSLIGFIISDSISKIIFGAVFLYSLIAFFILNNEIHS